MAYTAQMVKDHVTLYGGPEKVASIIFNNAYRKVFTNEHFSFEKHLDEVNELFVFEHRDPSGTPFVVIKPIEFVEGIVFVKDVADFKKLSHSFIAG